MPDKPQHELEVYSRPLKKHILKIFQNETNPEVFTCRVVSEKSNRVMRALEVVKPGVYRIYEVEDVERIFRVEILEMEVKNHG